WCAGRQANHWPRVRPCTRMQDEFRSSDIREKSVVSGARCQQLLITFDADHSASPDCQTPGKSAQRQFSMTIDSFRFLFGVFNDLGPHQGRKLGGAEHATDHRCREARILVIRLKESPDSASRESK